MKKASIMITLAVGAVMLSSCATWKAHRATWWEHHEEAVPMADANVY